MKYSSYDDTEKQFTSITLITRSQITQIASQMEDTLLNAHYLIVKYLENLVVSDYEMTENLGPCIRINFSCLN